MAPTVPNTNNINKNAENKKYKVITQNIDSAPMIKIYKFDLSKLKLVRNTTNKVNYELLFISRVLLSVEDITREICTERIE
jgi:hypothetical protein